MTDLPPPATIEVPPPLGKREATKAANREEIRAAAIEAFSELGFGATTVRDIVRRTSLASGTFYNYYADKDAILSEFVQEHVEEADRRMTVARQSATTPREAVELGAAAYFGLLMERADLLAMFRRNAGTIRAYAAGDAMTHVVASFREDLDRLLADAGGADLDTELLASGVMGAGMDIAMRFAERGGEDPRVALGVLRALLVDGILGRADG
jgi:AcrR family transcriptional regulator